MAGGRPLSVGEAVVKRLRFGDDRGEIRSGAENMAVDEALLMDPGLREKGPVLRIYRWDGPTLSFGYFIPWEEAEQNRMQGEAMVRRWTGGGMVHHAQAFTWTLVVPMSEDFCRLRPSESYLSLHRAVAGALSDGGMEGLEVVASGGGAPAGGLCAEAPVPGDVLWNGRKVAGAGQRRTRQGLLHQGVLFLPEKELPADFSNRLSQRLAEEVEFCAGLSLDGLAIPVERYSSVRWNQAR